jgi:hypothetical protein
MQVKLILIGASALAFVGCLLQAASGKAAVPNLTGPPWNSLGVVASPDGVIEWSNGTIWRKTLHLDGSGGGTGSRMEASPELVFYKRV